MTEYEGMEAVGFENLFKLVREGTVTPYMADHAVQKAINEARQIARREAIEEATKVAEEWESETDPVLRASDRIRQLSQEGPHEPPRRMELLCRDAMRLAPAHNDE